MPRKPRQLPAQNTLPYLLLTLTALCGEYPIRQISHLPGGSAYLESVVTALRRDGLLRTFSKDGLRGLRLTSSAKRLLLADAPEWFSAYLTGSSEPNKLKSEISRRLRLHRMAEILTIMHNADIPAFPWEKAPFSAASQSAAIPAYYTSREVKEIGPQGAKIKSSRATGILLTDGGIFLTYNTAKAQMKWEYKAELRFKALLQTEGVMPDAEISGIVFGSTMEQLSILTQPDAHSYFLLDGSFPHFYYLTNDRYEVVNPYEGDLISNANLFISQYCAAKNLDFAAISLTDMEQILRAGLTHLYSFSRTMEMRTVPAEEDGEEDTLETWYIYTIRYNGEAYFADTIFALTDEQKSLAENYAENLSLFLGDGLFQYAPSTNTITALGDVRFTDGETEVIYFNQLDERYANQPYGTDHIGGYGCGPTSMAIVVSSLTSETVDPVQMARWAYEHGYWCSKSGSYHTLIPGAAQAWGLSVEGCTASEPQRILDALADGKLVVALMTKGHFTKSGHFIVLRGVQDEKILVADPASYRRSQKTWDLSIILNEASRRAGAGGPFWIIGL